MRFASARLIPQLSPFSPSRTAVDPALAWLPMIFLIRFRSSFTIDANQTNVGLRFWDACHHMLNSGFYVLEHVLGTRHARAGTARCSG